jgi:hypothetical protein
MFCFHLPIDNIKHVERKLPIHFWGPTTLVELSIIRGTEFKFFPTAKVTRGRDVTH